MVQEHLSPWLILCSQKHGSFILAFHSTFGVWFLGYSLLGHLFKFFLQAFFLFLVASNNGAIIIATQFSQLICGV